MDIKWNKHIVIMYEKDRDDEVAAALKYYLEKEIDPCDVVTVDSTSYTNVVLRKVKQTSYRFAVKHARGLLKVYCDHRERRAMARIRENAKDPDGAVKEGSDTEIGRVINIFKRFNPVFVICTTPYALSMALRAERALGVSVNIVGMVSDFALDPAFVQLTADGYFVENPEVKQKLIQYGVEPERIVVIGMPSLQVNNTLSREEQRRALGINNDLPVVLVDGGVYGTETIREDIELLMRNRRDFNLIVVVADKKKRRYYMDLPDFSADVILKEKLDESLLNVANVFVTVPNSKTIFGAFMRGISVVIAQSVTVLEHEIRRYLVKRALVIPTRTPRETLAAVDEILQDANREAEFCNRGQSYAALSLQDMRNLVPNVAAAALLGYDGPHDN